MAETFNTQEEYKKWLAEQKRQKTVAAKKKQANKDK